MIAEIRVFATRMDVGSADRRMERLRPAHLPDGPASPIIPRGWQGIPMTDTGLTKDAHQRDVMEYDVIAVGAGPAGLAFAMRIKQLKPKLSVCVIEKASTVGAQILSG